MLTSFITLKSMLVSMISICTFQFHLHNHLWIPKTDPSVPTNDYLECATAEWVPPNVEVTDAYPNEIRVLHDPETPKIEKGALFPDITSSKEAIRQYAVKTGFVFAPGIKTSPRDIAKCKHPGCPWHIHASWIHDHTKLYRYFLTSSLLCIHSIWVCKVLIATLLG